MRLPRLASALLLLLALLAPTAAARMASPSLTEGDFHEYRSETVLEDGTTTRAVERRSVIEVGPFAGQDGSVASVHVRTEILEARGDDPLQRVMTLDEWIDVGDWTLLRLRLVDERGAEPTVEDRVYEPGCPAGVQYPLEVGANWTALCSYREPSGRGTAWAHQGEVLRLETVTVRAGTFDAYVVRVQDEWGDALLWVAEGACGPVRTTDPGEGAASDDLQLTSMRCDAIGRTFATPPSSTPGDLCAAVPGARCTAALEPPAFLVAVAALALVAQVRGRR